MVAKESMNTSQVHSVSETLSCAKKLVRVLTKEQERLEKGKTDVENQLNKNLGNKRSWKKAVENIAVLQQLKKELLLVQRCLQILRKYSKSFKTMTKFHRIQLQTCMS